MSMTTSKRAYGQLKSGFLTCRTEALVYGKCLASNLDDLRQNQCQKEFSTFKACVLKAVRVQFSRLY